MPVWDNTRLPEREQFEYWNDVICRAFVPLRADPRTANTPVVVVSADATPRAAEALAAQGADAFLTKPLDVRAFLSTVERLIARVRRAG